MRKKNYLRSGLVLLLSVFIFNITFAQQQLNTITTAVPFLMISPDARAGGMGEVGAATIPDANAIQWNPAKLAFINKNMGLSLSYSPWMHSLVPDVNLAYLSVYKKIGKQTLALSAKYFDLGNITFTSNSGAITGKYNPHEFAIDIAYAKQLSDHFSGSIAFRYIYSNLYGGMQIGGISSKLGQSIAEDFSCYYQNKFSDNLSYALGGNISNIGSKITYTDSAETNFIPTNLKIGTSVKKNFNKNHSLAVALDLNKLLVPTPGSNTNVTTPFGMIQSFYDAPGGFKEELQEINYSAGIEYLAFHTLALRTGYFYENRYKGDRQFITLGTGINYKFLTFDFSYYLATNGSSPLDKTMKFSLACNIDKLFSKKEKSA